MCVRHPVAVVKHVIEQVKQFQLTFWGKRRLWLVQEEETFYFVASFEITTSSPGRAIASPGELPPKYLSCPGSDLGPLVQNLGKVLENVRAKNEPGTGIRPFQCQVAVQGFLVWIVLVAHLVGVPPDMDCRFPGRWL